MFRRNFFKVHPGSVDRFHSAILSNARVCFVVICDLMLGVS